MFLTNQIAQNEVIYFTYYTSQFTYYTSQFTYHTAEWTRCEQNSYTVVAWKKIWFTHLHFVVSFSMLKRF